MKELWINWLELFETGGKSDLVGLNENINPVWQGREREGKLHARNGTKNKMLSILIPLYKAVVWSYLEYYMQFLSLYLKILILEKGKILILLREATQKNRWFEKLSYERRLEILGLFSFGVDN